MKRLDPSLDAAKRNAAARAVAMIENKMVLGLGSGSTASFAIELIGRRVADGLHVVGIPTSERSAALARKVGVPLSDFSRHRKIDLTIDGADQIEDGTLNLVKGLGGAMLREKIVAEASARMIVVADHSKRVRQLGAATPLPVELVPFGWEIAVEKLEALGCNATLRRVDGAAFTTDGGNVVADCRFERIPDAAGLQAALKAITGVVETGLFVGLASLAVLGTDDGVTVLER
ncbi:ribose-5-phosphate isomerase RpiA [Dongia sp.]|uniref:ribose-5-phosphate isomerase RpiA n=1 Tax=Dongia sp. TaxID=1977262 RepID=UPI00375129BA